MAVLVIGTLTVAGTRDWFPLDSSGRRLFGNEHYQIGVGIFILVWIRLAWRLRSTEPAIMPPPPYWQRTCSSR